MQATVDTLGSTGADAPAKTAMETSPESDPEKAVPSGKLTPPEKMNELPSERYSARPPSRTQSWVRKLSVLNKFRYSSAQRGLPKFSQELGNDSAADAPSESNDTDFDANPLLVFSDDSFIKFTHRRMSLNQEQWEHYLRQASSHPIPPQQDPAASRSKSGMGGGGGGGGKSFNRARSFTATTELAVGEQPSGRRPDRSVFGLPLVSPVHPVYKAWSNGILLLDLVYTAFLVPILVCFETDEVNWTWGCLVDFIAGVFFVVELFLGFHVGFVGTHHMQKAVIMDGQAIARYYLRNGFVFDLLATIAWLTQLVLIILVQVGTSSAGNPVISTFQIVRVLRLIRFTTLLKRLYASAVNATGSLLPGVQVSHAHAYFLNLVYGGAVLFNLFACVWNFTARREGFTNTWVNYYAPFVREYSVDGLDVLTKEEASHIPGPRMYLTCLYYVVVTCGTIGYGEITPANGIETGVSLLLMLAGIVFFGILLGSIADVLQRVSQDASRAAKFRQRMEAVDGWMTMRHIPRRLRNKISSYYAEEWIRHSESGEEMQIYDELPAVLRKDVAWVLNAEVFEQLELLKDLPRSVKMLVASLLAPVQVPPGAEIGAEGSNLDCMWVLHEGTVSAWKSGGRHRGAMSLGLSMDPLLRSRRSETAAAAAAAAANHASAASTGHDDLVLIKGPALLGEQALLRDTSYRVKGMTYRAETMCSLWELRMEDLAPLLEQSPELHRQLTQHVLDLEAARAREAQEAEEEARALEGPLTNRSVAPPHPAMVIDTAALLPLRTESTPPGGSPQAPPAAAGAPASQPPLRGILRPSVVKWGEALGRTTTDGEDDSSVQLPSDDIRLNRLLRSATFAFGTHIKADAAALVPPPEGRPRASDLEQLEGNSGLTPPEPADSERPSRGTTESTEVREAEAENEKSIHSVSSALRIGNSWRANTSERTMVRNTSSKRNNRILF